MIITLTGANDLLRAQALAALLAAFIAEHSDMAVERFDGEEADAAAMRGAVASLPFLSARKLVVLHTPSRQKAFVEDIAAVLADIADTTDLIIHEPKLDKRLSYYKTLKKQTDFQDFAVLDAHGLARWASEYARSQGGTLAPADARLLVDRNGPNQFGLKQELDKLLAYDPAITRRSVELLTEPLPQSTVFDLLEAAFAGKTERAFALYNEQRALRVEPQEIIAMLAWQLHVLAVVASGQPRPADEIAKPAKLHPFVVRKSAALARRLPLPRLKRLMQDLLQLDLQLKRSAIDADEALQLYLLRLSQSA